MFYNQRQWSANDTTIVQRWANVVKLSGLVLCCCFLYINDISTDIDSETRIIAEDCVCYREIKDTEDTLNVQKDIVQLGCWARKWGMRYQRQMQYKKKSTLEGTVLENVESIKYLGVTITNKLR